MDDRDHIIRLGKCLASEARAGYINAPAGGLIDAGVVENAGRSVSTIRPAVAKRGEETRLDCDGRIVTETRLGAKASCGYSPNIKAKNRMPRSRRQIGGVSGDDLIRLP